MDFDESEESPHFFKIIHSKSIHEGKLRIPPKFVTNYGKSLSSCVFLNVPNGNVWLVNLIVKENGDVWLDNGWKEFADYYSVSLNHFLVFIYKKNSIFEVLIFDKSASEIQYPPQKSRQFHALNKKQVNSPPKSMEFDALIKKQVNKRESAMEEAESFGSKNPFFTIKICKNFKKCSSIVPKSFRVEHFKNMKRGTEVELMVAIGNKKWPIVYKTSNHKLMKGWCGFARENCLKVGDVCVFKSTEKSMNFFNVTVFRARKK